MSADQNQPLTDQDLLEYLFDCFEEPERMEAALAASPELRARLESMRGTQGLLAAAATDESMEFLDIEQPDVPAVRRVPIVRLLAAAAVLYIALPWASLAYRSAQLERAENLAYSVTVSGFDSAPNGAPRTFELLTTSPVNTPLEPSFEWTAFGEDNRVIAQDQSVGSPSIAANVPASLVDLKRLEVRAHRPDWPEAEEQTIVVPTGAAPAPPLVHLTTDKPLYRPGETAYLRAVLLNRLTLEPLETLGGRYLMRISDPKDVSRKQWFQDLEDGVLSAGWSIPDDAAGGRYHFELLSGDRSFTYERLPFEVRHFQSPLLAKTITLSQRTFAPGQHGTASVRVERIVGGVPAGAEARATLLVDGERVWSDEAVLDGKGRAGFSFEIPEDVERGEGRFVVRIVDGGAVETAMEPFVIPLGATTANLYPEGGALLAGVPGRVYFEAFDANGRPVSAAGSIIDSAGIKAGEFQTEHLGRGRFEITPTPGESYRLEFETPDSGISIPLPLAVTQGASLRVLSDSFAEGEDVVAEVRAIGLGNDETWTAGLFCRGQLVAQSEGTGSAPSTVHLAAPDHIGGVLRLTLLDHDLQPLAERLVHRRSARRIEIEVTPSKERSAPGEHQTLDVMARDENGRPVAAVIGLTVTDRAVRDEAGVPRVGLADQAWLFGDVEWDGPALEERGELLERGDVDRAEHGRRVDLLLGTRGWRRFAWVDRDACVAAFGDAGKRLMAREGYSDSRSTTHAPSEVRAAQRSKLQAASRKERKARSLFFQLLALLVCLAVLVGLWRLYSFGFRALGRRFAADGAPARGSLSAAAALCALSTTVLLIYMTVSTNVPWSRFGRDGATSVEASMEQPPGAGLEESELGPKYWRAFTTGGIPSISEDLFAALDAIGDSALTTEVPAPSERSLRRVRVYSHRAQRPVGSRAVRDDFTETVYWNALLKTSVDGRARVEFDLSERPTTWHVFTDAHGTGRVGQGFTSFESVPALRMEARLPVELTQGDRVAIPVAITAEARDGVPNDGLVQVAAAVHGSFSIDGDLPASVALKDGRGRLLVPILAGAASAGETGYLALGADINGFQDRVVREVRIVPRGFPKHVSKSGLVGGADTSSSEFVLGSPETYVEGSLGFSLKFYPSPLADLLDGAAGILKLPHGCFEQASATNYPNVLALSYLEATGLSAPGIEAEGRALLERGYELLTDYECRRRGFEWFGQDPGHEVLSAYGLLEFTDMAAVYPVDDGMVGRTAEWLLGRRDGEGGFRLDPASLDSFGRAPAPITNAYCTYALAVSGTPPADLSAELDRQASRAVESSDPYEVAAAVCGLAEAGRDAAAEAGRERLKTMQADDGHLAGTTSSITRSGGSDLVVETTAFAVLAWLGDEKDAAHVDRALSFLITQRSGSGRFGSTQATIMALRAMTQYAQVDRTAASAGEATVYVNDAEVRRVPFADGVMQPIEIADLQSALRPGANRVRVEVTGGNRFPWAADLRYFSEVPADAPDATVGLEVALDAQVCTEGDAVGLDLVVRNLTDEGQPMTMAIVGLPAGLECTTEVLDDLREAGRFDLWERRGREVILYWRDLAPSQEQEVHLDLIARIPGTTTGAASRAYLYYTQEQTRWAQPLTIEVLPAR